MTYPWEQLPVAVEAALPPATADVVQAMQRDLGYMVSHTAILVHSNREELRMLVNTARGQIVPRGQCKFTDGTTLELQDIGMPQPNCSALTVVDLMARVWEAARELGLELER